MSIKNKSKAGERTQIQVVIETRNPGENPDFQKAVNEVIAANPQTRKEAADIINRIGFFGYTGGRHVALIYAGKRLAMFTSNAPDFN